MAGSYNHVVTDDGNLRSNERIAASLENFGDVFEAIEEMYGMIWYLTQALVEADASISEEALAIYRKSMKAVVEEARQHYQEGLTIAKEVNARA